MMVPVGRIVILKSVPKRHLVTAMSHSQHLGANRSGGRTAGGRFHCNL